MNDPGSSQILTASSADDLDRPLASDPLNLRTKSRRPALGSLRKLSSQPYRLSESATNDIAQPWTSDNGDYNVATPSYADGSWDLYSDFVGSLQFWGYALASGSADGGVRMWDMRTGQAHRTLMGHSAPVTSLQFDEYHLISGSLDKSIRVWDLRTGSIAETLRFDGPVTALQFDSRKIVAATGENGVRVSVLRRILMLTELMSDWRTGIQPHQHAARVAHPQRTHQPRRAHQIYGQIFGHWRQRVRSLPLPTSFLGHS